jgi:hypothetical protein
MQNVTFNSGDVSKWQPCSHFKNGAPKKAAQLRD